MYQLVDKQSLPHCFSPLMQTLLNPNLSVKTSKTHNCQEFLSELSGSSR